MDAGKMIRRAKKEGRHNLTEAESKQFLKQYGIPVVQESVAGSVEEAVDMARRMGFPVVLKGLGAKLMHKTEKGLVRLNLKSPEAVRTAAETVALAAGQDLEGFLLQPMIEGRREFVAGMFVDGQFGPVVMFGLGGVLTEALQDVVFMLAPIEATEAAYMLKGLRAITLLDSFRGEAPVRREQLIDTLTGLSRMAIEHPDITEVDINPLVVSPDGTVTAVDALIVFGDRKQPKRPRTAVDPRAVGAMFSPKSIAFVGASATFGKWGYNLFSCLVMGDYQGKIYLVNAKEKAIAGRPVYASVLDIPDTVDLAVVTIPAAMVSELIPQFKAKGIKNMLLISSGFSEAGENGRRLEDILVNKAEENGILILGPNTMGICNPHAQMYCMAAHVRPQAGTTTLIAQSGNLGTQLLAFADKEGIGIRAFCGSGNEAMITIEDFMDCCEVDELTKTAVLYLESIKDGRRFFESARRVGHKKPVIVLKGGRTDAGSRAAASHTGAMASNMKIFDAACRQAGIILAEQPSELLDLSAAFDSLPLPKNNRIAVLSLGGGWGVVATDLCVENGLTLPHLSPEIIAHIDKVLPPYWSRSNPIDLVAEMDPNIPRQAMEELMKWDGCDAVIHLGIVGRMPFIRKNIASALASDPNQKAQQLNAVSDMLAMLEKQFIEYTTELMATYEKPIIGVCLLADETTRTIADVEGCRYKAITFQSPEQAVKALARMFDYQSWRKREGLLG